MAPPPKRPSIPSNWDRCFFYVERKGRFCHVRPAEGRRYCGNHMQHERHDNHDDVGVDDAVASVVAAAATIKTAERRVDCPLRHTSVYKTNFDKHLRICPITKKRKIQENQTYFESNVNAGGSGWLLVCEDVHKKDETVLADQESAEWAQRIARRVLETHQSIFGPLSLSTTKTKNPVALPVVVETITLSDIHNAIPLRDLSGAELKAGMERGLETHHIKTGGARHIPQLASLVGHLREMQVLPDHYVVENDNDDTPSSTTTTTKKKTRPAPLILLEMGAGRGMFGLTAAGVACACDNHRKVNLVMVERTGTRAKAEKHLRNKIPPEADTSYMKIDAIQWCRVNCDMAHVNLPTVLHELHTKNGMAQDTNFSQHDKKKEIVVVIAKHLCGTGTDLALKSMASIRNDVDACLLATCCHGVCDWQHYVGRDYLRKVMLKDTEQESSNYNDNEKAETNHDLKKFGREEFELMSRWCGASVARTHKESDDGDKPSSVADKEHQRACTSPEEPSHSPCNISVVVKALNLSCGIQGLGRACQRLIDYGRYQYLRKDIFGDKNGAVVDLNHYTPPEISPQNAILRAFCRQNEAK